MRLSKAQQKELLVWEYFIPTNCKWLDKTDLDLKMFFEWSEKGKHKNIAHKYGEMSYFNALVWGKKRAYIHAHEMYEPGILDGSFPYVCILGIGPYGPKVPIYVKDFLKKEMFKGIDATTIEKCYEMDT